MDTEIVACANAASNCQSLLQHATPVRQVALSPSVNADQPCYEPLSGATALRRRTRLPNIGITTTVRLATSLLDSAVEALLVIR